MASRRWRLLDWCYRKVAGRLFAGDAPHLPTAREQARSMISAVKERINAARTAEVADEVREHREGGELFLQIHSSHGKSQWIPPKTVRIKDTYFRLQQLAQGRMPRPFIFRLRRVAAGAAGRMVIVYEAPRAAEEAAVK